MIDFETIMYNVSIYDDALVDEDNKIQPGGAGKLINLRDICQQYNLTEEEDQEKIGPTEPVVLGPKCFTTQKPLDFIYEKYNDTYNLSRYEDDRDLLEKIQTGKGDEDIYTAFINLYPDLFLGGTEPPEID